MRKGLFDRDVWCLLGLLVDNASIDKTKGYLRSHTETGKTKVWSTVNVNWFVLAMKNKSFRKSILKSDIVTIDGMPLLWLARSLGYPMTEVVAGSSLIHELTEKDTSHEKISIFFFGGEEGAGKKAFDQVNESSGELHAVGYLNPGFGSIEEMSRDEIINQINKTNPDILLVALGAQKGMQWIGANQDRLNARVVSHLGATINFLAGTVKRAPISMRRIGFEWSWRILQEPKLFTRYFSDGLYLLFFLLKRIPNFLLYKSLRKQYSSNEALEKPSLVIANEDEREITLLPGEAITQADSDGIHSLFSDLLEKEKNLIFDFSKAKFVDGKFIGLLLLLETQLSFRGKKVSYNNVSSNIEKLFDLYNFGQQGHP